MKRLLILAWVCTLGTALAQLQVVVVPNDAANVEGNSSSADLFVNGTARMVQVYSATEFNFSGAPTGRIDGVAFRLESGTAPVVGFWNVSVGVGTTSRSPDGLSPIFDDNLGADSIMVRAGLFGISATNNTVSPRPFEVQIPFTSPFFYDPTRGNLALSIVALGSSDVLLDAQFASGDGVGRVFGPNSLSGTVDTLGLVTRFDFTPIPEPSGVAMLGVGAIALLVLGRPYSRREHFSGGTAMR